MIQNAAPTGETLRKNLRDLEGRSYREYKCLKGDYEFPDFCLSLDHVQGDPFAAPSRISLRLSQQVARFPTHWLSHYVYQTAIGDYVTRQVVQLAQATGTKRGSGKSGQIEIALPSQAVLRRTAVSINSDYLEARLTVGLPAFGRRIAGQAAAELLCDDIPQLVARALRYEALDADALERHVHTIENAEALRAQLTERGLIAFIAEGAQLPRRSGIDERPLPEKDGAEPFVCPPDDFVVLDTPHNGPVKGLGIRAGVSLIVGGGFHGKSTLLRAIEQGIYNHVPGDGREQVVSTRAAVKLRAEDGRSVTSVNISPVINQLPKGRSSEDFSTANASGSTSQTAGLMEAVEAGAQVLLIDEDTAATNVMIRDRNMQALIAKGKEPITPFVDKVRQLYDERGISTILVMGGSGDYFVVADTVIAMEDYQPRIVTEQAKAIGAAAGARRPEGGETFGALTHRAILPGSLPKAKGDRPLKIKARRNRLMLGYEEIDLSALEQLVEVHQGSAIAQAMIYAQRYYCDGTQSLSDLLDCVMSDIERSGLDVLAEEGSSYRRKAGNWATFRRFELAAAFNRLRTVKMRPLF